MASPDSRADGGGVLDDAGHPRTAFANPRVAGRRGHAVSASAVRAWTGAQIGPNGEDRPTSPARHELGTGTITCWACAPAPATATLPSRQASGDAFGRLQIRPDDGQVANLEVVVREVDDALRLLVGVEDAALRAGRLAAHRSAGRVWRFRLVRVV
jgi:hypothetical protein